MRNETKKTGRPMEDLTGKVFGRLKVIEFAGKDAHNKEYKK